jgi:catechol 2,3-dioxygenase-like lactoylglutathione lyase family enzyme
MPDMALVEPGPLHRLALAVDDAGSTHDWFTRIVGAGSLGIDTDPGGDRGPDEADLAGTDTRLFRVGGFPIILLSKGVPGGPVAKFLGRYGPGAHSLAWEVADMWVVQNLLVEHGIGIGAVNIPGRHFFMHPRNTHGVLMEWTDDTFGPNGRRADEGGGVTDATGLAWVAAVVTDADATASFLTDLVGAKPVDGNAHGPADRETTVDLAIGDVVLRLITPRSPASPYEPLLAKGPRLCSFALRVGDLGATTAALEAAGVPTLWRQDGLVGTDPAATCGLHIEWTD